MIALIKTLRLLLIISIVSILLSGCGSGQTGTSYTYEIPQQLDDGWTVSSLIDQGIDEGRITDLNSRIIENDYPGIHSLLIVKNGNLVFENYYNGFDRDRRHRLFSVTKSVASCLIGIAIDGGNITETDQLIRQYFPEYSSVDWSGGREQITIDDLLTMRAGFEWEELEYSYVDSRNSHYQMTRSSDWILYVLQRPMAHVPGTSFEYNTGTSNMFAKIIERSVGVGTDQFAQENLFDPLGITSYYWNEDNHDNILTGGSQGGLELRGRDIIKIGYVYLNDGLWSGERIISTEWISRSKQKHVIFSESTGYGYQWWIRKFQVDGNTIDAYYALGYGGQYMFIVDQFDMVVYFASGNYENDYAYAQILEIMNNYIFPAVR